MKHQNEIELILELANPRGFCAGVDRAISIVEEALKKLGPPIYVRHEVVHNRFVVNNLKEKGAIFVEELSEIPDNSIVIFSAHGVSKQVENEAKNRKLTIFDATCPLVTKVHLEVLRYSKMASEVILIGHAGHPEVEGTMGRYYNQDAGIYLVENQKDASTINIKNTNNLFYVTQTTLSINDTKEIIDVLKKRFPNIKGPKQDDICYATQNRQSAVKELASRCDLILVVGSPNSSNSNRLRELAEKENVTAYLIDNASEINLEWFHKSIRIGITAGASAPEVLVKDVINFLKTNLNAKITNQVGKEETIQFALPKGLR